MYYRDYTRYIGRHVYDLSVQKITEVGTLYQEKIDGFVSVLQLINKLHEFVMC